MDGVTDTVADTFTEARRRVEEQLDSARTAFEVKKEQVQRALEAGRAAAQQAREELERRIAETKAAYQSADAGESATTAPSRRAPTATVASRGDEESEET